MVRSKGHVGAQSLNTSTKALAQYKRTSLFLDFMALEHETSFAKTSVSISSVGSTNGIALHSFCTIKHKKNKINENHRKPHGFMTDQHHNIKVIPGCVSADLLHWLWRETRLHMMPSRHPEVNGFEPSSQVTRTINQHSYQLYTRFHTLNEKMQLQHSALRSKLRNESHVRLQHESLHAWHSCLGVGPSPPVSASVLTGPHRI